MRNKASAIFLIASFVFLTRPSFSQICFYNWTQQSSGTTNILTTCSAVNEFICWAAGNNATVRRTTDGGITWINANPNPSFTGNLITMEAVDENIAFVVKEAQLLTVIYRTSNGGISWDSVYGNTRGYIKGIRMISPANGIAVGDPINNLWNILLTSDGGITWFSSPHRPAGSFIHQGFHNSIQVSMPDIYWGTSFSSVYRSTDGGTTFNEITANAGIYIFAVHFNSSGIGLASSTSMVRSTDGGLSYQAHSVPGAGNINAIQGNGNDFWFIRGSKIYHSTDDGLSWAEVYTAPLTLSHMSFPEGSSICRMGWAVGYGGTILKMSGCLTSVNNTGSKDPLTFSLKQNYPNPFNPETKISFDIPVNSYVKIMVYDHAGKLVQILLNNNLTAGSYSIKFDASAFASGAYFYRIEARLNGQSGNFSETKMMLLIK